MKQERSLDALTTHQKIAAARQVVVELSHEGAEVPQWIKDLAKQQSQPMTRRQPTRKSKVRRSRSK